MSSTILLLRVSYLLEEVSYHPRFVNIVNCISLLNRNPSVVVLHYSVTPLEMAISEFLLSNLSSTERYQLKFELVHASKLCLVLTN